MGHAEVVDAAGGYIFVVKPQSAGGGGIEKREVEVENLFGWHTEFPGYEIYQQIVGFKSIVYHAYHRQHVFLFGKRIAFVHLTVEVNGEMGNGEERASDAHCADFRLKHVAAVKYHPSGD